MSVSEFKNIELTQPIVHEFLDYYPDTGLLFWRWRDRKWFMSDRAWSVWNTRFAGCEAFTSFDRGYKMGAIFHKTYKAHRIIFLHMTSRWPDPEVDHINHDRSDNRWVNLEEKSHRKNNQNKSLNKNNTNGHVGVSKYANGHLAQITVNGHQHSHTFSTYEEAVVAREAMEREYGFHPNHGQPKNEVTP
jgi:hypothetical protein